MFGMFWKSAREIPKRRVDDVFGLVQRGVTDDEEDVKARRFISSVNVEIARA